MNRTIVVGDIHGCLQELRELIKLAALEPGDRLVFVGDVFDRGPDPLGCLRTIRDMGADIVLGNHDEKHLRWRRHEQARLKEGKENPMPALIPDRLAVHQQVTQDEWEWIESWPTHLDIGYNTMVVHAGFLPKVAVKDQLDRHKLHIRWVDERLKYVSQYDEWKEPEGCWFWTEVWDGPCNVVYGHAAISLIKPRVDVRHDGIACWGVDTACVFGGHLSAFILPERRYIQVKSSGKWADWKGSLDDVHQVHGSAQSSIPAH